MPVKIMLAKINPYAIAEEIIAEYLRARNNSPPLTSPHEGKAVIEEKLDELWELVKRNIGRSTLARNEAIQIAAMSMRYIIDLCDGETE